MSTIRLGLLDRLACWAAIWGLRRLFGECETDVRADFPDDPDIECAGCEATRMIRELQDLAGIRK